MGHGICRAPLFSSSTLPDSSSLLTFTVAHAKGWKENATRDELEAYWSRELKKATTETECKTVCSCADVRVPMDSGDPAPGHIYPSRADRIASGRHCLPVSARWHFGNETWYSDE